MAKDIRIIIIVFLGVWILFDLYLLFFIIEIEQPVLRCSDYLPKNNVTEWGMYSVSCGYYGESHTIFSKVKSSLEEGQKK